MLDKKLVEEIKEYCRLNDIKDYKNFINVLLQRSFNLEKYGSSPFNFNKTTSIQTEEVKLVDKPIEENKEINTKKSGIKIVKR